MTPRLTCSQVEEAGIRGSRSKVRIIGKSQSSLQSWSSVLLSHVDITSFKTATNDEVNVVISLPNFTTIASFVRFFFFNFLSFPASFFRE